MLDKSTAFDVLNREISIEVKELQSFKNNEKDFTFSVLNPDTSILVNDEQS
jgi:hypothetical protein